MAASTAGSTLASAFTMRPLPSAISMRALAPVCAETRTGTNAGVAAAARTASWQAAINRLPPPQIDRRGADPEPIRGLRDRAARAERLLKHRSLLSRRQSPPHAFAVDPNTHCKPPNDHIRPQDSPAARSRAIRHSRSRGQTLRCQSRRCKCSADRTLMSGPCTVGIIAMRLATERRPRCSIPGHAPHRPSPVWRTTQADLAVAIGAEQNAVSGRYRVASSPTVCAFRSIAL